MGVDSRSKPIDVIFKTIDIAKAKKEALSLQLERVQQDKAKAQEVSESAEMAQALVRDVAIKTQVNVGERISGLVSLALASVFDDPYAFKVDFVMRRAKTEADLVFVRDGYSLDPISASGGGAIDIASFALRLAVWTLCRTRPLFILDEPFRNLSLDLQAKAGLMLHELAHKLGVQIIMVSHNPEIISGADRVFRLPL